MVVNSGGYRVFLCDTVTGKITRDLPVSEVSWSVPVNDAGTVEAKTPAGSDTRGGLRVATTPVRQSLGVAYGDVILECGPIWGRSYDPGTDLLTVTAAGLWSIFDRRKALPGSALMPGAKPTEAVIQLAGMSLGSIAAELVRIAVQDNPYGLGGLNVILPPLVGGSNTKTYNGFDLGWIGERLRQLTGLQKGPDIRFRPRFNGADPTIVEWVMETGTTTQPLLQQTGPDWLWDATTEGSPVTGLAVDEDATQVAAVAWVPGSGSDTAMPLAYTVDTTKPALGWPWTEVDTASKQIEDVTVLQDYADRLLADSRDPWETWSIEVRADHSPRLGDYLPGDWATITLPRNHPMVDPGTIRVRIMAVDGDGSNLVKLTVAPIQGSFVAPYGDTQTVLVPGVMLYPSPATYPSPSTYPVGSQNAVTQIQ